MASAAAEKEDFKIAYVQQGHFAVNPLVRDFMELRNAPDGVGRWMDRSSHVKMNTILRDDGFKKEPTHRLKFEKTDGISEPILWFVYDRPDPTAPVTVQEVLEVLGSQTQEEYKSGARDSSGRALLYVLHDTYSEDYSHVIGGPRRDYDPVSRTYTRMRPGAKVQTLIIPVEQYTLNTSLWVPGAASKYNRYGMVAESAYDRKANAIRAWARGKYAPVPNTRRRRGRRANKTRRR